MWPNFIQTCFNVRLSPNPISEGLWLRHPECLHPVPAHLCAGWRLCLDGGKRSHYLAWFPVNTDQHCKLSCEIFVWFLHISINQHATSCSTFQECNFPLGIKNVIQIPVLVRVWAIPESGLVNWGCLCCQCLCVQVLCCWLAFASVTIAALWLVSVVVGLVYCCCLCLTSSTSWSIRRVLSSDCMEKQTRKGGKREG